MPWLLLIIKTYIAYIQVLYSSFRRTDLTTGDTQTNDVIKTCVVTRALIVNEKRESQRLYLFIRTHLFRTHLFRTENDRKNRKETWAHPLQKRCDISVFNGTMAHAFPGHCMLYPNPCCNKACYRDGVNRGGGGMKHLGANWTWSETSRIHVNVPFLKMLYHALFGTSFFLSF